MAGSVVSGKPTKEGCTPGYWKNHLDSWVDYEPDDLFSDVFGVGSGTLEQALNAGGDKEGYGQLGFHGVAALLNASNPGVYIGWTEAEVIDVVADAWVKEKPDRISAKNTLAARNELGCPLN